MAISVSIWAWTIKLKPTVKLVLLALSDHANDEGTCFPSVNSLSKKTCLSKATVIKHLKELQKTGLIKSQKRYSNGSRRSNVYCINSELSTESIRTESIRTKSIRTDSIRIENMTLSPDSRPISFNRHLNVKSNSTPVEKIHSNKTQNKKNKLYKKYAVEILNFLNEKANKNFKQTETNLGFITQRIKEFEKFKTTEEVVQDCKMIIAKKCREWMGDKKTEVWLRPETLFCKKKFSGYEGELVCAPIK